MSGKRKRQVALSRVLERAQQPTFLLDEQLAIVAANEALATLVGLPLDDILGQNLKYHASVSDDHGSSSLHGLCPPPSQLNQFPSTYSLFVSTADGSTEFYPATIAPLLDEKQIQRWFVVTGSEPLSPDVRSHDRSEAQQLHHKLVQQHRLLQTTARFQPLLGDTAWMQQARDQFQIAIQHRPRVMVCGPPGSGTVELAQAIHYATENAGPLVPLDCEILDAELLQSTIFQAKKWMMEQRELEQGWFLLKNVETLRREAQNELMGMLGLPNFELPTLTTTSLSLDQLSQHAEFNASLARLLGTLVITLPPLSARAEDIPLIAQACVEDHNLQSDRQLEGFAVDAMDELCSYRWPGELEEFHAVMHEVLSQTSGPVIQIEDLPKKFGYARSSSRHAANPIETIELDSYLAKIEQELIDRAIRMAGGNKTRAAELLGVSRARIHRKTETEVPSRDSDPSKDSDVASD